MRKLQVLVSFALLSATAGMAEAAYFDRPKSKPVDHCCAVVWMDRDARSLTVLHRGTGEVWRVVLGRSVPAGVKEGVPLDFDATDQRLLVPGYQPIEVTTFELAPLN